MKAKLRFLGVLNIMKMIDGNDFYSLHLFFVLDKSK